MNAETHSHKHGAAHEAAQGFELRLYPGDRVTARWRLLDIRVSAPATVLEVHDDCVQVAYGCVCVPGARSGSAGGGCSEVSPATTRWLPLSSAADWSPDHGVFPLLKLLRRPSLASPVPAQQRTL